MGADVQHHAPAVIPPGKRHGTHCLGGWVGPRAGLDGWRKSCRHRDSIPGPSSSYRVAVYKLLACFKHESFFITFFTFIYYTKCYPDDQVKTNEVGGAYDPYGGEDRCIGFWWGNLKERDHTEDLNVDGNIILKWILNRLGRMWNALIWLSIGTKGWGLMLTRKFMFGFHKRWGIAWLIEELLSSEEGLLYVVITVTAKWWNLTCEIQMYVCVG